MRETFNFLLRRYGLLFLGCALLVGTAVIVILPTGDQLRYRDEVEYDALARHLRAGDGFVDEQLQPSAKRPPAYPYFLAGVYRLWERPVAAKLANAVMLGLVGWMLARIGGNVQPAGGGGRALRRGSCYFIPYLPTRLRRSIHKSRGHFFLLSPCTGWDCFRAPGYAPCCAG